MRRALAWYTDLPHNRYVVAPVFDWLGQRWKITLPLLAVGFAAEVWFLH